MRALRLCWRGFLDWPHSRKIGQPQFRMTGLRFLVGLRLELDFESSSFIMGFSEAI